MNLWEEIREKIEKDDEFATMPHIAAKVMKMIEDPDTTAADLEKFISVDQVLTAEILKLANSPLYAPRVPIASLKHAISYLGLANIRSLVLMVAIRSLYTKGDKEILASFWKHAAASAIVAKNIVLAVKGIKLNAEEMFTMGLLHDFGKVVLFKFFPDKYREVIQKVQAGESDFYTLEKKVLGIAHTDTGAMVLSKWGFPIDIVNAVGTHHDPPNNELTAILHLVNSFCSTWGYSMVQPQYEIATTKEALELVKIDEDNWRKITENIKKQLEESAEILSA